VINIQAREITDNLTSLVKQIDSLVDDAADRSRGSKHAFVVLLTGDPDAAEEKLAKFAKHYEIKNTPLTVFDGISGPPGYKIAKDAEVTVMMWSGQKVDVNHAFAKGELDAAAVKTIVADAKKHLQ
jgi:hypothetical protein